MPRPTRPPQAKNSPPASAPTTPPSRRRKATPFRPRSTPAEAAPAPSVRLQKALADAGLASRREIEAWISAGRVLVNDKPAELGQRIGPGDRVKVGGRLVNLHLKPRPPRVLLYHKPEGEIVSRHDPQGRPSVFNALPRLRGGRWVAIGRLDYNSCGLLVFTNDGALAHRLMHPRYRLEREYAVRILGEVDEATAARLLAGIELEDGLARFTRFEAAGGSGANRWYRVTLEEGRKREVRRMFAAVGLTVSRLMRVRYGPLTLPANLRRGQCRELSAAEVEALLQQLARPPES